MGRLDPRRRFIWVVLDSVGIGAAPDAGRYGASDTESNTLRHVARAVDGLHAPFLAKLGLGRVDDAPGLPQDGVVGAYGRMQEQSFGKDTTNGHWEYVGVVLRDPLPVYPNGFPQDVIRPFEQYIGQEVLCNRPASGTEVIEKYGEEHQATGRPIVYTSADSVFQVAAHEDVIPVEQLYDWCLFARTLLVGKHGVGRVIARPFIGCKGSYQRTHHRKDFSLTFGETVLNSLSRAGWPVSGIGKIGDIYGESGITEVIHTKDNMDGVDRLLEQLDKQERGLVFINLVDFDAKYGHRNDAVGFARAIEAFDRRLPEVLAKLRPTDTLFITADHGCDPTTPGTDHSREWVPLLVYQTNMTSAVDLGDRRTFADLGATLADAFELPPPPVGTSFWPAIQSPSSNPA